MLDFVPSPTTSRGIRPSDFGVVTPYTGQVLEIRYQLRKLDVDMSDIMIATTNHAQGKREEHHHRLYSDQPQTDSCAHRESISYWVYR
jgi:hypothetical protein